MANCEGDEWCDCVKWLKACGVLGVAFHATRAHDVAQALRDGVVLCHLTNVIKPGSLDKREFTQRPTMSQFLCLKNIKCFLKALRTHFSMRDSDLFDPNDLFELLDFKKVMKTLSKLSRTEAAQVIAEGFFVHTEDDDIYKNLADLDSEMPEDDIYGEIPAAQNDEKDEDIYEDLCALRTRRRENKSMRMSHQSSTESFSESGARESVIQKTKLDYCIEEILGTEKRYVEVLEMINEQFMEELQSILLDHMDVIFMNVAELYKVHKDLLRDLEKAQASDIYKIPAVFIAYKNKLVGYGDYCSGLITAQTTIDDLMSSSSIVRAGINSCQEKVNNGKFKLRDLLVVPMQRVLKYPLLLREMQKNSKQLEEGSEESKSLNLALEAMKDLSYFVNEVKRDKENLEKIAMVEASIEDLSMPQDTKLEDYGHLLRDGKLEIRSHDMGKESKRYVFLFDKVMLMCKTKGDTYSYKSAYVLHQFNLEECAPGLMHLKKRHAFMLAEKSKQNVITFYCPTDETKRKWMDSINLAMDNFSPPGAKQSGHDFIMQSFSRATECTFCKRLLTGSFYQGYLCSKTKKTAHKQCIQKIVSGERPNPPRQRALSHRETRPKLNYKSNRTYNGVPAPPNGHKALAFAAGLNIDVINQSDPHWWIGCIRGGEKGYFPSTSVSPANPRDTRVNSTHRASSSVAELSVRPTPRRPSRTIDEIVPTLPTQRQAPHLEYVNLQQLDDFPWYVGTHDKASASRMLDQKDDGVFLIRESRDRPGEFALGVAYQGAGKHIKVLRSKKDDTYYLSDTKFFSSLPTLVSYYSLHSLVDSFPELPTNLQFAYKEDPGEANTYGYQNVTPPVARRVPHNGNLGGQRTSYHTDVMLVNSPPQPVPRRTSHLEFSTSANRRSAVAEIQSYARVTFDYSPTESNQIRLRQGEEVAIVSKAGGDRGWWKGGVVDPRDRSLGQLGYFPLTYVEEIC